MSHIRTQIRNKIKNNLSNITFNGDLLPVFFDDPSNIQPNRFPCIAIKSSDETSDIKTLGGANRYLDRLYSIEVSIVVMSNTNLQEKIDDISVELEKAMSEDKSKITLDGLVKDSRVVRVAFEFDEVQQKQVALAQYLYEFRYMNIQSDPETSI